jgi:TRAP-type transport system periplasmic protein
MPNLSFFACAHAQDNTITGLKMTHVCSLVAALFVPLLNLSLFASGAHAQEIKECQLKLAFLPSDQHSIGLGAKRFAELVAEKTAGKIKIRSFPGGALGGDLSVISALQGGTIEMTIVVTSNLAGAAKDFSLLDTPLSVQR